MSTQTKVLWLGLTLVVVHMFASGQWSNLWHGGVANTSGAKSGIGGLFS
jgi:hypothetical protein